MKISSENLMQNPFLNLDKYSDWKSIYSSNSNITVLPEEKKEKSITKINVCFRTNTGININIIIDNDKTVEYLIQIFFKRVDKMDLFHNNNNSIYFIYNANKIDYNEKKTVGAFFRYCLQPIIIANDVRSLIGAQL